MQGDRFRWVPADAPSPQCFQILDIILRGRHMRGTWHQLYEQISSLTRTDEDFLPQRLPDSVSKSHLRVRHSASDENDHPLLALCVGCPSRGSLVPSGPSTPQRRRRLNWSCGGITRGLYELWRGVFDEREGGLIEAVIVMILLVGSTVTRGSDGQLTSKTICTTGLYRDSSYSPSADENFCLIRPFEERSLLSWSMSHVGRHEQARYSL
jgi:hypothetical protein